MPVTILVPVYNDWPAVVTLIRELDRELALRGRTAAVVLVDDGSSELPDQDAFTAGQRREALTSVEILHLRHNLGHQRAIAVGLAYLDAREETDAVIVMDGDGEDLPSDVNRLLDALAADPTRIVFAERRRRSEGLVFTALYHLYRGLHAALTGERVRVGNFSAVPRVLLRRLVAVSDLWNNYSAAVFHTRIPVTMVPTNRGRRYAGHSKMGFVSMVVHGLGAMSVYGDRIGVRLLFGASLITAAAVAGSLAFWAWQLWTGAPISPWSLGLAALVLLLLLFVMLASSLGFVFIILSGRGHAGFLPFRDFGPYVSHVSATQASDLAINAARAGGQLRRSDTGPVRRP
jgi:hypothetical protein